MNRRERESLDRAAVARAADRVELTWHRCRAAGVPHGWYREHRVAILDRCGGDPRGPAVAAVLSPRVAWERVLECTPAVLAGERPSGFFGRSLDRAARLVAGEPFPAVVPTLRSPHYPTHRGPKTRDFRNALLGEPCSPVADVWAARVAGLPVGNARQYGLVRAAYVLAADRLGEPASEVQARTWRGVRDYGVPIPTALAR